MLPGKPSFLGYIPEGFRTYGGIPIEQQAKFLRQIDKDIHSQVISLLRGVDPDLVDTGRKSQRLGAIKHFGSLVPASQREGTPIQDASGSADLRAEAKRAFDTLARTVDDLVYGA